MSKNLGHPYTQLFSSFVAPLFLECYDHVDDTTRSKMEEMLVTWRTGGPGGVELFGQNAQLTIERAVWGDVSSGSSSGPTRNQVLMELDVILTQKTRALDLNSADRDARNHVEVLHQVSPELYPSHLHSLIHVLQLRGMVQNSRMTQTDLNAIVVRLRDLARTTASSAPPPPSIPPPPSSAPQASISPPSVQLPSTMPMISNDLLSSALSKVSSIMSQPPRQAPPSSQTAMIPPGLPDVSQLYQSLIAAGLIPGAAAPPQSAQVVEDDSPKFEPIIEPKPALTDAKLVAMREYENRILALPVSTTASGLQRCVSSSVFPESCLTRGSLIFIRPQPAVLSILYDDMPLKCAQCARRFADNEAGRTARDDHLDMHFRQNKRASQVNGRGHTRSWFVGVQVSTSSCFVSLEVCPTDIARFVGLGERLVEHYC